MSQPTWKLLANLGDVNPLDYGGYFVYTDETGVYGAEAELLRTPEDTGERTYTVYRFELDRCTYQNGVLSDNKFHPDHSAWFAQSPAEQAARPQDTTKLANVASFIGATELELITWFCSDNPLKRAEAYRAVGDYHGFENLDSYPLKLSKREARARYGDR